MQRDGRRLVFRAGTADLGRRAPIRITDAMRLASVPKAFSGAAALALVARGRPTLASTVGREVPGLPRAWSRVTLRELLHHRYSNSDHIIVALMVQAVTGRSYAAELRRPVFGPLGLTATSLPRGAARPVPYVHGYDVSPPPPVTDVSHRFAAGWAWASGLAARSRPVPAATPPAGACPGPRGGAENGG